MVLSVNSKQSYPAKTDHSGCEDSSKSLVILHQLESSPQTFVYYGYSHLNQV